MDELIVEGERAFASGRFVDAYDVLSKAENLDENNERIFGLLGKSAHRLGRFDEARTLYSRCRQLDQDNWRCAVNIGVTYVDEAATPGVSDAERKRLYEKGMRHFERLKEELGRNPYVTNYLIILYLHLNRNEPAFDEARWIIPKEDVDPPLNIYIPYNYAVAALRLLDSGAAMDDRYCKSARDGILLAGRRATKYPRYRSTFEQLLRGLLQEPWERLYCDSVAFRKLKEQLASLGFALPSDGLDKQKSSDTESLIKKNEIYEHLPVFEFIVERDCQDPGGKYCDEVVFIKNIGSGQAVNLRIFKFPLPDNKQKRALSYQKVRINENISKEIPMLGIGDKKFAYREREYSGKNVKFSVRCKDIKNNIFEFTYEGEPRKLRLTHKKYLIRETGEKGSF